MEACLFHQNHCVRALRLRDASDLDTFGGRPVAGEKWVEAQTTASLEAPPWGQSPFELSSQNT